MTPTLTLMVCSIHTRAHFLERLRQILEPQLTPDVELLIDVDNGDVSIGDKRNRLIARARGRWCCFIDDDDRVAPNYVARILEALQLDPDCVGFLVARFEDGQRTADAIHSLRNERYETVRSGTIFYYRRTPNHLNPIRTEIVQDVGFPKLNHGEDSDFAKRVYPQLLSEVFIAEPLYFYDFRRERPGEITHLSQTGLGGPS